MEFFECTQYEIVKLTFIFFFEGIVRPEVFQLPSQSAFCSLWPAEINLERSSTVAFDCFTQAIMVTYSGRCYGICCFTGVPLFRWFR